ncbi:MAG: sigma-70 family RNA polymerase sigma factor, partial [Oscillospiraceae bacterium]|nr:sigma-70 family RNA polymerase sigma factor [Oscillospiraceae bacterium]
MEDRDIIERVLGGDNDAFSLLVEKYQTKVYNLALRMSGNEDDAFDLAQDSFVRAWRNLGSFQFESSFSTWLFRLTSNICLDFLRAKKRRAAVSLTVTD